MPPEYQEHLSTYLVIWYMIDGFLRRTVHCECEIVAPLLVVTMGEHPDKNVRDVHEHRESNEDGEAPTNDCGVTGALIVEVELYWVAEEVLGFEALRNVALYFFHI